jgi:hypothetical protein
MKHPLEKSTLGLGMKKRDSKGIFSENCLMMGECPKVLSSSI